MPNLIRESVRGMESLTPEDLLFIAEKTGKSLEEIYEKTREDSYFNAQEAIVYGLATGIVDCTNSNRAFLS